MKLPRFVLPASLNSRRANASPLAAAEFGYVAIVLGLLVLLAGCRDDSPPPKIQVKGTVTVAGEGPLTGGSIQFVLVEDPTKVGGAQIQGDGTYDVFAPRGKCKVIVTNEHLQTGGKTGENNIAPGGIAVPPGAVSRGLAHVPIDPSYAAFKTTPLTSTVTVDGASPTDFELQPPPSDKPAADDKPAPTDQ